mgnify:CR=1 FL=1
MIKAVRIRLLFLFGLYVKKFKTKNLTYISIEDRPACAYLKPKRQIRRKQVVFWKKENKQKLDSHSKKELKRKSEEWKEYSQAVLDVMGGVCFG